MEIWYLGHKMKNKIFVMFILGMFLVSLVSADYRFEDTSGNELMRLYSSNGNLSVLGNVSAEYFVGSGKYLTDISSESLNISEVNYWSKSGSDLFYNDGNVGIGTGIPLEDLHISDTNTKLRMTDEDAVSTINDFVIEIDDDNALFYAMNAAEGKHSAKDIINLDLTSQVVTLGSNLNLDGSIIQVGSNAWRLGGTQSSEFSIRDSGSDQKIFQIGQNAPANVLVLSSSGNVGIGTTSPSRKLEVTNGSIEINAALGTSQGINFETNDEEYSIFSNSNLNGLAINYGALGTTNYGIFLKNNGNVGIGTNNPQRDLEVNGSIRLAENSPLEWGWGNTAIVGDNSNQIRFLYNNQLSETMRIKGSNVGIGTTSPQEKLHVAGNAVFNGTINTDGNKIINLANGTAAQDAVTKSQLDAVNANMDASVSGSEDRLAKFDVTGNAVVDSAIIDDSNAVVIEI
jgi:hypothetical protein